MSTVRAQTEAGPAEAAPAGRPPHATDARTVSAAGLLALQRTAGNRAVGDLLARRSSDAKPAGPASETQPPVLWAKSPPDLKRMSRVALFDARNLIDQWMYRNAAAPDAPALRALRREIARRARDVTSEAAFQTLNKYSKLEPRRIRDGYLQVVELLIADRKSWKYDMDAMDELVQDREPGAKWPAAARRQLESILAEQDRAALAVQRETERRAKRHANLPFSYRQWYDAAEARAAKWPQDAYDLWRELSWLWIDLFDAGVDIKQREERIYTELSSLFEEVLRQLDALIQRDAKLHQPRTWDEKLRANFAKAWGDPSKPWFAQGGRGWDELHMFQKMLRNIRSENPFDTVYYWVEEYQREYRALTDPEAQLDAMRRQASLQILMEAPGALLRFSSFLRVAVPFLGSRIRSFLRFTMMGRPVGPGEVGGVSRGLRSTLRNTILGIRLAVGDLGGSGAEVGGATNRPRVVLVEPGSEVAPPRTRVGPDTPPELPERPAPATAAKPPSTPVKSPSAPSAEPPAAPTRPASSAEEPLAGPPRPAVRPKKTTSGKETAKDKAKIVVNKPPGGKGGKRRQRGEPEDAVKGERDAPAHVQPTSAPPATPKREQRVLASMAKDRVFHQSEEELSTALEEKLNRERPGLENLRLKMRRLADRLRRRSAKFAADAQLFFDHINDPMWMKAQMLKLWRGAAGAQSTVAEYLEQSLGGHARQFRGAEGDTRKDEIAEFHPLLEADEPFVDLPFADAQLSAHIHMFHEWLGDQLWGKGGGRRFRQELAKFTQAFSRIERDDEPYDIPLWSAVWDTIFDDPYTGALSNPEVLGKILEDDLDFPVWRPSDDTP
jgi:hypothetical protein